MDNTEATRMHLSRRDRGLIQIGRLQVRIEDCTARIKRSGSTKEEKDIARFSRDMYRDLLATETDTLPADRFQP